MYSEIYRRQPEVFGEYPKRPDRCVKQAAGTTHLSQEGFLNPPLHQPGEVSVVFHVQMSSDDRGAAR